MKKGFTLIELLVVVLVIGILAAVALPQYQKAVEKSRLAEAVTALENIMEAEHLHYVEHGYFGPDFKELLISMPNLGNGTTVDTFDTPSYVITLKDEGSRAQATRKGGPADGQMLTFIIDETGNITKYCNDSETGLKLCASVRQGNDGWEEDEFEEEQDPGNNGGGGGNKANELGGTCASQGPCYEDNGHGGCDNVCGGTNDPNWNLY
mgnify:CR=1 FL=1